MTLSRFATTSLPELYESRAAREWMDLEVEDFFIPQLKGSAWANAENIIVHGCRTGRIIYEQMAPHIERKFHCLIGMDHSESMIEYATKNFKHHNRWNIERHYWKLMDIRTWVDPDEKYYMTHRIFALHSLQFDKDWKEILIKMLDVICFNATVFGLVMVQSNLFKLYKHLKEHPDWKALGEDLYIPEWIENEADPKKVFEDFLKETGYLHLKVEVHQRSFNFLSKEECLEVYLAMNPRPIEVHASTPELRQALLETCLAFLETLDGAKTEKRFYTVEHDTLVFQAQKWKPWTETLLTIDPMPQHDTPPIPRPPPPKPEPVTKPVPPWPPENKAAAKKAASASAKTGNGTAKGEEKKVSTPA